MLAKASEGARTLAMASKRVRSAKWDDSETMLLAKSKREAFLRGEEGGHVWHDISQTISGRSAIQCQRRWETLVKVYSHVQDYCTQTGQDHEELDDEELASMRLETAYRRDWYIIVEEVCSERKRRRICDGGAAAMLSKELSTPIMETLPATLPVITSPDSDCENITIFQSRKTLDFENHVGQGALSTVRWAPNSPVRWAPDSPRWDTMASSLSGWVDASDELNFQVEQTWTMSERLLPRSLSPECPRHDQGLLTAGNFTFNCFSPPISFPLCFPPSTPDSMSNGLISGEALDWNGLFQRNTAWPAYPTATRIRTGFIRVHKVGSLGRSLNLGCFSNCKELIKELAQMYSMDDLMEGSSTSGWEIVYVDNENDTLLVGDDPMEEFLSCVRSIRILSPAEVEELNNALLQLGFEMWSRR